MSISDSYNNFTSSLNIQGKFEDPHAKTNFDIEIAKLEEDFKKGIIPLSDYQTRMSNLIRMKNRPKNRI